MADTPLVTAIKKVTGSPETLTRADVALITEADPALGEQARAAREKARSVAFAESVAAAIRQAVTGPVERIAALEAANRTLTEQLKALADDVLMLQAALATRAEPAVR